VSGRDDRQPPRLPDPDQALVERAQRGDDEAFEALVRTYQHRVVNFAHALVSDRSDAEDVAQEAFLRAYRGLGRFRGASSFRTWLYQIVTNTARTHLSRQRDRLERPAGLPADTPEAFREQDSGHDAETSMVRREAIDRALATLSPELREAVVLRDVEGWEYREIAAALGVPIGTVESRIFRARARLRDAMAGLIGRRKQEATS
jgi:RNA polymerase sigma-70 factor (ECF subfamily)